VERRLQQAADQVDHGVELVAEGVVSGRRWVGVRAVQPQVDAQRLQPGPVVGPRRGSDSAGTSYELVAIATTTHDVREDVI
jgi:hypothetical protein